MKYYELPLKGVVFLFVLFFSSSHGAMKCGKLVEKRVWEKLLRTDSFSLNFN